jgi:ribonuclease III
MEGAGVKRPADDGTKAPTDGQTSPSSNKKQKTSNGNRNGYRPRPYQQHQNKHFGKPRGPQATYSTGPPGSNPIGELKNGLAYLESGQFSEEARFHAQELQKIIFGYKEPNPETAAENGKPEDGTTDTVVKSRDTKQAADRIDASPFASSNYVTEQTPTEKAKYGIVPANKATGPTEAEKPGSLPLLPTITDLALLSAPFTHTSTLPAYVQPTTTNCYEPLEFLGDAYIEVIATRLIHNRFPDLNVGQWANLRSFLVQNETLNKFSKAYGFDQQIAATQPEKNNEKTWTKIVADVFEAYVAAIILSDPQNGFVIAENWLQALWKPKIAEWLQGGGKNAGQEAISPDAKVDLQKLLTTKGTRIEYAEERPMELIKEGNITRFYMGVYFTGFGHDKVRLGSGIGKSKNLAGVEAAKDAFIKNMPLIQTLHKQKLAYDIENKKGSKSVSRGFR